MEQCRQKTNKKRRCRTSRDTSSTWMSSNDLCRRHHKNALEIRQNTRATTTTRHSVAGKGNGGKEREGEPLCRACAAVTAAFRHHSGVPFTRTADGATQQMSSHTKHPQKRKTGATTAQNSRLNTHSPHEGRLPLAVSLQGAAARPGTTFHPQPVGVVGRRPEGAQKHDRTALRLAQGPQKAAKGRLRGRCDRSGHTSLRGAANGAAHAPTHHLPKSLMPSDMLACCGDGGGCGVRRGR